MRRRVYWHPAAVYALAFLVPVFVLVGLAVRRKVVVRLPLCHRHRRGRLAAIASAWMLVPLGIVASVRGLAVSSVAFSLIGLYTALAGAVVGGLARVVTVSRIADGSARLRGAHLALLDRLPDRPLPARPPRPP